MSVRADVRYAFRLLRRSPVFCVTAIATLALGIGGNTTTFSLLRSVLLHPLPYADPDRLVMVWEDASHAGFPRNTPAPGNFNDWRELNRSFVDMAATRGVGGSLTMDGPPEQVIGRAVSANFFAVLGVTPALGRTFVAGEDSRGAQVIVISHALWQRRYGGDARLPGRTLLLSDARYEVIGVAPKGFVLRDREVDYWIPMQLPPPLANTRGSHFLNVVARLRPDVSVEAAQADMRSIARRLAEQFPESNRDIGAVVVPMRDEVLGDARLEVIVLSVAAAAILLIACANLASLLLSRAAARTTEYATRLSLGATRAHLVRQLLVEATLLSAAGAAAGLALASLARSVVEDLVPAGLPLPDGSPFEWPVLVFAALMAVGTGLLFSVGPAFQITRRWAPGALQHQTRTIAGGPSARARDGLVVFQVAAALMLLVAAGLMLRTLASLAAIDLGFRPERLLTMRVAPPQPRYADPSRRLAFYERVLAGVSRLPGVERAAFASTLPFESIGNTRGFRIEGFAPKPGEVRDALFRAGTAQYLATLGVRILEGRFLDRRDHRDAPRAIVINQTMAERYWPDRSPIGGRIGFGPDEPWYTIVGVVEDILERGYGQSPKDGVYVTTDQAIEGPIPGRLIVRVAGDPLEYVAGVREAVRAVDAEQAVSLIRPMEELIGSSIGDRRQQMVLLVAFGLVALLIACVGLYGLLAQSVAMRRREIGLRIALGATWRQVIAMVMTRGVILTISGGAIGAIAAAALARAMRSLLYGIESADPLTFGTVVAALGASALIACAVPAVRAARVDPIVILREQ